MALTRNGCGPCAVGRCTVSPQSNAEAQRERLRHDQRVATDGLAHRLPAVARRLEHERAVRQQHVEIARARHNQAVAERQAHASEAIDRRHVAVGANRRFQRRRDGRLRVEIGPPRRGDVEVGLQRLVDPIHDGLTEAADHHRDRHEHREAHRERGDRDREARDRAGQVRVRQPALDAAGARRRAVL